MKIRIYYEDVDIGGIVYHAKYLHFCERARSELFFAQGMTPVDDGYHFIVKELQARYIKPARFGEEIEVRTELRELRGASLQLRQRIYREDELLFEMDIVLVCIKNDRPAKIPPRFLEALRSLGD